MSIKNVKKLLEELQIELKKTNENLDSQTQQKMGQLDNEIQSMLANQNLQQQDLYDGIKQLEYGFLTEYPTAANLMRGIVDLLSKAGI